MPVGVGVIGLLDYVILYARTSLCRRGVGRNLPFLEQLLCARHQDRYFRDMISPDGSEL